DAPADAVEHDGTRAVDDLGPAIQEPERPLRAGEPLLDRIVRADELLERLVRERQRDDERDEVALRPRPADDAAAAVPDDERDREAGEHLRDRQRADAARPHEQLEDALVLRAQARRLESLLAEDLHDAVALNVLVQ